MLRKFGRVWVFSCPYEIFTQGGFADPPRRIFWIPGKKCNRILILAWAFPAATTTPMLMVKSKTHRYWRHLLTGTVVNNPGKHWRPLWEKATKEEYSEYVKAQKILARAKKLRFKKYLRRIRIMRHKDS